MGLALYRKYRPKGLADVVGQAHIVTSLQNALKTGKISHAYLFTGPRGVGKTSVARILAHEINGLPYTDDSIHMDIIEIDAASNRRIDEIRELRDKVHVAPTSAKYKVYIIDEVHMLTREAFNALLKTLEEPPAHVVFILATTEAHKVPDTIASRTQRFNFKPISRDDTVTHLQSLAEQEKVKIDTEALGVLADHASGSFRDSINLLDQMVGGGEAVYKTDVEAMLGIPNTEIVDSLRTAIDAHDIAAIAEQLQQARIAGVNAGTLALALSRLLRESFLQSHSVPTTETVQLLRQLVMAAGERDAYTALELALFEYASVPALKVSPVPVASVAPKPVDKPSSKPVAEPAPAPALKPEPTPEPAPVPDPTPAPAPESQPTLQTAPVADDAFWGELLGHIKKTHNTIYGVLRIAQPQLEGNKLTLVFKFAFHQKQMSQAATQQRIADAASELLGRSIEVTAIINKDVIAQTPPAVAATKAATPKEESSTLKDVSNFFEGAELLE